MKSKAVEERSAIISDSFLRSYSLSRIVRLNEENRNKAKVIIMKKLRGLKKNQHPNPDSPFKSYDSKQNSPPKTHIQKLKQQLTQIDECKPNESRFKQKRTLFQQAKDQNRGGLKSSYQEPSDGLICTNQKLHRRFKSDEFQSPHHQTQQIKTRAKVISQQNMKAELKLSEIKFTKYSKIKNLSKQTQHQDEDESTYCSSLSATLSSFNRLRLMTNAKQSDKIMKHFYKRSLQNCSLEQLKCLIKLEVNRKQQVENDQNKSSIPMKFGKTQILSKGSTTPLFKEASVDRQCTEKKKSVWNNEVIRQSCGFEDNAQIVKPSKVKTHINSVSSESQSRVIKKSSKHKLKSQFKEKAAQKQLLSKMNSRESQMQTNLVYCYQDKRFPTNENKLSGIYEKWQQEYTKKKRVMEIMHESKFSECQVRQIKVDSIRFNRDRVNGQSTPSSPKKVEAGPGKAAYQQFCMGKQSKIGLQ